MQDIFAAFVTLSLLGINTFQDKAAVWVVRRVFLSLGVLVLH